MSKICVNCGVELEQIAVFCDECGTRQPSIQGEQQPTPQQAFPQVSQAMPQQAASQVPSVSPQAFPQMPQGFSPYGQATQSNDTCSNTPNIPSEVVEIKQPYSSIEKRS